MPSVPIISLIENYRYRFNKMLFESLQTFDWGDPLVTFMVIALDSVRCHL
jgi:hypothetical protein